MHDQQRDRSAGGSGRPRTYPAHHVTAAIDAAAVDAVREELGAAGFGPDRITVHAAGDEESRRFREDFEAPGVWGSVRRFALSLGADLDLIREAEAELDAGDVLIEVEVHDEPEKHQVRDVLLRHGGHFIHYFGSWTIETLA